MKYIIVAAIPSICFLLRSWIIEHNKYKRYEKFKELYPNESFEKLTEYEEKSKVKLYSKKVENEK